MAATKPCHKHIIVAGSNSGLIWFKYYPSSRALDSSLPLLSCYFLLLSVKLLLSLPSTGTARSSLSVRCWGS